MLIPFGEIIRRHGIVPTGILHVGAHTGEENEAYLRTKRDRMGHLFGETGTKGAES